LIKPLSGVITMSTGRTESIREDKSFAAHVFNFDLRIIGQVLSEF